MVTLKDPARILCPKKKKKGIFVLSTIAAAKRGHEFRSSEIARSIGNNYILFADHWTSLYVIKLIFSTFLLSLYITLNYTLFVLGSLQKYVCLKIPKKIKPKLIRLFIVCITLFY